MDFCNHDGVTIEVDEYGPPRVTYANHTAAFPHRWLDSPDPEVLVVDGDRITVCGNVVYEVTDWHHRCPSYGDAETALARLVSRPPQAGDAEMLLTAALEPAVTADEEITLDEDWDSHLREGDYYPDRYQGAVLMPGTCGCFGRRHTWDWTPAKARRIAARLVALAEEAEKVEPARLLTQEEADAR